MSLRTKFIITNILLLLALLCAAFAAQTALGDFQSFQTQNTLTRKGDVHTIRSWMTIPYVAYTYHIPESYLYHSLDLPDSYSLHHTTLHALSIRYQYPVNSIINKLQNAILVYRKHHPQPSLMPSPSPDHHNGKRLVVERKST